jgi:hypothetical protein
VLPPTRVLVKMLERVSKSLEAGLSRMRKSNVV